MGDPINNSQDQMTMSQGNEVLIRLARIEEKMDHRLAALDEKTRDHEARLRASERFQWTRTGATAVIAAGVGYVIKVWDKI